MEIGGFLASEIGKHEFFFQVNSSFLSGENSSLPVYKVRKRRIRLFAITLLRLVRANPVP
jgi:hypothetical protein